MDKVKLSCRYEGCEKSFLVIEQERKFYERKGLPFPDHCPSCRHKQRMALRHERTLYRRDCDCCEKSMLTTYPPEAPYKIYCHECFWENIG